MQKVPCLKHGISPAKGSWVEFSVVLQENTGFGCGVPMCGLTEKSVGLGTGSNPGSHASLLCDLGPSHILCLMGLLGESLHAPPPFYSYSN